MSKLKKIIIISVILGLILLVVLLIANYMSFKTITFSLSSNVSSVKIYQESTNSKPIATLNATGSIRIKPGKFFVIPNSTNGSVSTEPIEVSINNETSTIIINPYYSSEYLSSNFTDDIKEIDEVIINKYSPVASDVVIHNTQLFHYGEWGVVIINKKIEPRVGVDFYSVVVKKDGDSWVIVSKPSIVQSYSDNPDVPRDIIHEANEISSSLSFSAA